MAVGTTHEQFLLDLGEIYDAEQEFLNGMLEMEEQVSDEELGALLREHIQQTEQHVKNLDRAYDALKDIRQEIRNEAASALVTAAHMAMQRVDTDELRNTAASSSLVKAEQYEVASYRSLITAAMVHGHERVAALLRSNLEDEEQVIARLEEQEPRLIQQAMYQEKKQKEEKKKGGE